MTTINNENKIKTKSHITREILKIDKKTKVEVDCIVDYYGKLLETSEFVLFREMVGKIIISDSVINYIMISLNDQLKLTNLDNNLKIIYKGNLIKKINLNEDDVEDVGYDGYAYDDIV
jgi:hypothetical protein